MIDDSWFKSMVLWSYDSWIMIMMLGLIDSFSGFCFWVREPCKDDLIMGSGWEIENNLTMNPKSLGVQSGSAAP